MASTIKAIDLDSVHRLHAGQVVLELQAAIKELVENSLDAGASGIDVRIKDHGLDSIEVSDNGSGIAESDWPFIGLKHHTSKLPALSALPHVRTFGFRGEALSSLCALCEAITLTTSTRESAPMGAVIKLGRDGRVLDSSGRIARPRGTTVTVTGLFAPLPVRRKEFERMAKREFTKALTLLYAYALVPARASPVDGKTGVRLRVESVAAGKGGKRTTLLSTDGRGSLRSSVSSVWGPKALDGVLDVSLDLEVEVDQVMARREGLTDRTQNIRVSGLISSAAWGQGRSSPDRQFYFINGRPCDLRQVGRAVNEVYKSFNTHQVPLAVLDFQIPPESVDINVSPDKRTVLLHSEANLIAALKTALETYFLPVRSSYVVQGASENVKLTQARLAGTPALADEDDVSIDVEGTAPLMNDNDDEKMLDPPAHGTTQPGEPSEVGEDESADLESEDEVSQPSPSRRQAPSRLSNTQNRLSGQSSQPNAIASSSRRVIQQTLSTTQASWSPERNKKASSAPAKTTRSARINLRERLRGYASRSGPVLMDEVESEEGDGVVDIEQADRADRKYDQDEQSREEVSRPEDEADEDKGEDGQQEGVKEVFHEGDGEEDGSASPVGRDPSGLVFEDEADSLDLTSTPSDDIVEAEAKEPAEIAFKARSRRRAASQSSAELPSHPSSAEHGGDDLNHLYGGNVPPATESRRPPSAYRDEITTTAAQGELTLRFDLPRLRNRYSSRIRRTSSTPRNAFTAIESGGIASAAGIGNKDAATAEEALSRVISKTDFSSMEVLGQFNKGFIIARLGSGMSDDLFIIDQHASDEKFNFETLQRTTAIKAQSLIKRISCQPCVWELIQNRPRPLQLTAGDEIVAMENLEILRSNGFEVDVDEDKPPGRGERISLVAMPVSKETTFDFKDLEQLLHLVSDGARPAGQMVRCSKARSMFAMRACRRSVMIGKSLTKGQMVQLLRNMGSIDQPWNCPHGRPTMRHLTKIEPSTKAVDGRARIDWSKWRP